MPGIPPADKDDGENYLAFLVVLKNLLRGKSVSIAAPSSYFYLKNFPIETIGKIVDYIVYMTYDFHGQVSIFHSTVLEISVLTIVAKWDAGNNNTQIGCPSGMCLRSHVNLTETMNSMVMVSILWRNLPSCIEHTANKSLHVRSDHQSGCPLKQSSRWHGQLCSIIRHGRPRMPRPRVLLYGSS